MLTKRQRELFDFIDGQMSETGICPSYDEMKDGIGLSSKSSVHRLIIALEERGFIRRLKDRARSVEIISRPDGAVARRQNETDVIYGQIRGCWL